MLNTSLDVYDSAKVTAAMPVKASGDLSFYGGKSVKTTQDTTSTKPAAIDEETLSKAVKKLNDHIAPAQQSVQFSVDQESHRTIVKVVDTATNKVLRQMPNEEALAMSRTLGKLQGLMIKQTA